MGNNPFLDSLSSFRGETKAPESKNPFVDSLSEFREQNKTPFTSTLKSTGAGMLNAFAGQPVEDAGAALGLGGLQKAGQAVRNYAEDVQKANPSSINRLGDIAEHPWDAVKTAVGNVLPQIPVSLAGAYAGAKAGGALPLPPQGKAIAAGIGGLAGAFIPNYAQESAEMRGKQHETGQEDMGKAYAYALPAAGLETASDVFGLSKVLPKSVRKGVLGKLAGDELLDNTNRLAHVGTQFAKGAGVEAGTEYAQTALEQMGGNQPLDTEAAADERNVSAALGGIGGGLIRGGLSAFDQAPTTPYAGQSPDYGYTGKGIAGPKMPWEAPGFNDIRNQPQQEATVTPFGAQTPEEVKQSAAEGGALSNALMQGAQPVGGIEFMGSNASRPFRQRPSAQEAQAERDAIQSEGNLSPEVYADNIPYGSSPRDNWQTPAYQNRPDAEKIVNNRTVGGLGLQSAIDNQYQPTGISENDLRQVDAWQQPQYDVKQNQATTQAQAPQQTIAPLGGLQPQEGGVSAQFKPTHELSDGTPAVKIDTNLFADENGNEFEDDYARPINANSNPGSNATLDNGATGVNRVPSGTDSGTGSGLGVGNGVDAGGGTTGDAFGLPGKAEQPGDSQPGGTLTGFTPAETAEIQAAKANDINNWARGRFGAERVKGRDLKKELEQLNDTQQPTPPTPVTSADEQKPDAGFVSGQNGVVEDDRKRVSTGKAQISNVQDDGSKIQGSGDILSGGRSQENVDEPVWRSTRDSYFNNPAKVRRDVLGGQETQGYRVHYEYENPSPAGPFKGSYIAKSPQKPGSIIGATFGRARVISSVKTKGPDLGGNLDLYEEGKAYHKRIVANALEDGEPVPAEVLADYPDLQAKYAKQTPKDSPIPLDTGANPSGDEAPAGAGSQRPGLPDTEEEIKPPEPTEGLVDEATPLASENEYHIKLANSAYSHSNRYGARASQGAYVKSINSTYEELNKDLNPEQKAFLDKEFVGLKKGYLAKEKPVLAARSRMVSGHIAGRSNFNSKLSTRGQSAEDKARDNLSKWFNQTIADIKSGIQERRNAEQQAADKAKADNRIRKQAASKFAGEVGAMNQPGFDKSAFMANARKYWRELVALDAEFAGKTLDKIDEVLAEEGKTIESVLGARSQLAKEIKAWREEQTTPAEKPPTVSNNAEEFQNEPAKTNLAANSDDSVTTNAKGNEPTEKESQESIKDDLPKKDIKEIRFETYLNKQKNTRKYGVTTKKEFIDKATADGYLPEVELDMDKFYKDTQKLSNHDAPANPFRLNLNEAKELKQKLQNIENYRNIYILKKGDSVWDISKIEYDYAKTLQTQQSSLVDREEKAGVKANGLHSNGSANSGTDTEEKQDEITESELTTLFTTFGKSGFKKGTEKTLDGNPQAELIRNVQNHWLDVLADHGYEQDKTNGIKGRLSQTILMNGC